MHFIICQKSFENSTYSWNYQSSEWTKEKPVDTNISNQLYNNVESHFCENYPIKKVPLNRNIHIEQSDYTLTELQNVSSRL